MKDITQLLAGAAAGDAEAAERVLPLVYAELRGLARAKMVRERPNHTLQPTALVHEAWLRIVDSDGNACFQNRSHFFAVAAEAMRCILIDNARRRRAARHGGGQDPVDLDGAEIASPDVDDRVLAVNEALEQLSVVDDEKANVVKLRYFVGMSIEETAAALGIGERTVRRHWTFARAWLFNAIQGGDANP